MQIISAVTSKSALKVAVITSMYTGASKPGDCGEVTLKEILLSLRLNFDVGVIYRLWFFLLLFALLPPSIYEFVRAFSKSIS